MKRTSNQNKFELFWKSYQENKTVKYSTIIIGGIILIYLSGKAFNGIAKVIRSFNNMKSAINGN